MGGLLYKDFLSVKGKKISAIILVMTFVFLVLRLLLPGGDIDMADAATQTDAGLYDFFLWTLPALFVFCSLGLPSIWTKSLISNDEKSKIKAFTKALPFGKNTYIASKYIFIAVSVYILMSVSLIWCEIYNCNAGKNQITDLIEALKSFLIVFASASLVIAAVELPFFITLGTGKAQMIKTAILEFLFLLVIAGLFFGNLEKLANIDLFVFIEWYKTHPFTIDLWAVLSPVISSLLYICSYKLTCVLNKNREVGIDE